jgi:hypothetical protein
MDKAIFMNRDTARVTIINLGRTLMLPDETILKGKTYPVYSRGEMLGYGATLQGKPILEDQILNL